MEPVVIQLLLNFTDPSREAIDKRRKFALMTPRRLFLTCGFFLLLFIPALALSYFAYSVYHQMIILVIAFISGWTAVYLGTLISERERLNREVFLQTYELRKTKEVLDSCQATASGPDVEVYNERFLGSRLAEECDRSRRYERRFSCLLVVIDSFPQLAQRSGPVQARAIVQEITHFLKQSTRSVDIIIRKGEDRFVAILPETQQNQARLAAERIRYAVEKNTFRVGEQMVKLTVSVAVVQFDPTVHRNREDLLTCLEKTLEEATKSGPNRIVAFADEIR